MTVKIRKRKVQIDNLRSAPAGSKVSVFVDGEIVVFKRVRTPGADRWHAQPASISSMALAMLLNANYNHPDVLEAARETANRQGCHDDTVVAEGAAG